MQWYSAALIQAKVLVLHKTLVEENVTFCLLSETKLSCAKVSSFTIAGYQHHGVSYPSKGGGVSIIVREDLPVEVGLTVVASIEHAHATIHMSEGLALTVTSAYFPPGRTYTTSQLDTLLTTSGPHLIGADANAHAMAWDRAISTDTLGGVLVQWCLDNDYVIFITLEIALTHTTRHGPSAPDATISRECPLESWTASFSPDSGHYIILFEVAVGDDNEPLRFPRPRAPIYAWKKTKCSRSRQMSNAQCNKCLKEKMGVHKRERLPIYAWKKAKWSRFREMTNTQCNKRLKEKISIRKRERLLTSAIRIATAAAVPRGG
ncbi:Tbingi protein [Trypanosoma theileri]|uniref:Tbingi protein n=1 Tax=Trypanosoma theileri TaxID=67003 RepID=A0A1X0NFI7_9TRYP|nr:Tbingi protein [Trypanosoma theileri]ORC82801.1 Tbingi protein [Trypanosoma theileri]